MKTGMRQDTQIYRAIAVILVVAYHLKVPGFAKGFFGVDIFFIISGFLMAQRFLDTGVVLCTPGCQYASPTGKLFYWDEGHLTLSGASTLLPLFKGHRQKAMSE